jgi:hypothetical protein
MSLLRRTRYAGAFKRSFASRNLLSARAERTLSAASLGWNWSLKAMFFSGLIEKFAYNNSFHRTALVSSMAGIVLGAVGYGVGSHHPFDIVQIRKATKEVGAQIQLDIHVNIPLRLFIHRYRYVYVDSKGELVGTNLPRLIPGLGRIRLSCKKILADKY